MTRQEALRGWALGALAAACCGLAGCTNFWEEVTSNDFKADHLKQLWAHPDPLVVLKDSTDGDKRAHALRALAEPAANGGDQRQQDLIINILTTAATRDEQALCRMAAISALRTFRDPRVAKALEEAYYRAGYFPVETATVIRCQAIQGLGETGNPEAIKLLVKVLREPPVEGADPDKQRKLDERIAAARALGKFPQAQAAQALVEVLRGERDVALRVRAHESLQASTGQRYPADAQTWADYLNNSPDSALAREPSFGDKFLRLTGWDH